MTITDKIKKLLEASLIFEDKEKQEWLFLMSRMNAEEMQEFYQILVDEVLEFKKRGIELMGDAKLEKQLLPQEPQAVQKAAAPHMTPAEIRRELATPEIPAHKAQVPIPVPKPPAAAAQVKERSQEIKTLDDLKKLTPEFLRKGKLVDQTNAIRSKIIELSNTYQMYPYHMVSAFQQSPLFKAYLAAGNTTIVSGSKSTWETLRKEEFEAMADLRRQIENL